MSERPDYVCCVKRPDGKAVWCGRDHGREFFFTDIEHALLNGEQGGRLLMCQDCEVAICVALRTASSGAKPVDVERMDWLESVRSGPSYDSEVTRRLLTADEVTELEEMQRRHEARCREPETLPPELMASVDRVLAGKKRSAEERAAFQESQREALREVLASISEKLREEHGEDYDSQLGISSRGLRLLEDAWSSRP